MVTAIICAKCAKPGTGWRTPHVAPLSVEVSTNWVVPCEREAHNAAT